MSRYIRIFVCLSIFAMSLASCGSSGTNRASQNAASNVQSTGDSIAEIDQNSLFFKNLPKGFAQPTNGAERLLLREYGAVYVARGGAIPPGKIVFKDDADVLAFQSMLSKSTEVIGGTSIDLQTPAMAALREAR